MPHGRACRLQPATSSHAVGYEQKCFRIAGSACEWQVRGVAVYHIHCFLNLRVSLRCHLQQRRQEALPTQRAAVKVRYIQLIPSFASEARLPQVTELMHARAKARHSMHQRTPSMLHAPWGGHMLATGPAPWATMVWSKATMLKWALFRWPRGQPNIGL